MTKDTAKKFWDETAAIFVDKIGRQGIELFGLPQDVRDEIRIILASHVASELTGAGMYPALGNWARSNVDRLAETRVRDLFRSLTKE